jgi:hypothetical protein
MIAQTVINQGILGNFIIETTSSFVYNSGTMNVGAFWIDFEQSYDC